MLNNTDGGRASSQNILRDHFGDIVTASIPALTGRGYNPWRKSVCEKSD
jgi:hypothetical protein